MAFDPCVHLIKQLVIRAGGEIRKAKGLPEELNITTLYNETIVLLGIDPIRTTSEFTNKMPAPHESTDKNGKLVIPRKTCTECNEVESMALHSLCKSCTDSEGGQFKTMWLCGKCGAKEKSNKFLVQWLDELGVEFSDGTKQDMGIKTVTDNGIR